MREPRRYRPNRPTELDRARREDAIPARSFLAPTATLQSTGRANHADLLARDREGSDVAPDHSSLLRRARQRLSHAGDFGWTLHADSGSTGGEGRDGAGTIEHDRVFGVRDPQHLGGADTSHVSLCEHADRRRADGDTLATGERWHDARRRCVTVATPSPDRSPPARNGAVFDQCAGRGSRCGDLDDVDEARDEHRRDRASARASSHCAIGIVTPARHAMVREEEASVRRPDGESSRPGCGRATRDRWRVRTRAGIAGRRGGVAQRSRRGATRCHGDARGAGEEKERAASQGAWTIAP